MIEEASKLCFQRSYSEGVEFPKHEIIGVILKIFNETSLYTSIVEKISLETNLSSVNITALIDKWLKLGIIETFDASVPENEKYQRQINFFDALSPLNNYSQNALRQKKLKHLHIVIIGIGGIGNYAALSYVAMGIGKLTIIDGDKVESSNLSRQVLFKEDSIGKLKTEAAISELTKIDPLCELNQYSIHVGTKNELEDVLRKIEPFDFLFLSADKPMALPYWADELSVKLNFSFTSCSYQSYTGLVGPILTPSGKRYDQIVKKDSKVLENQSAYTEIVNQKFKHPSSSPSNAILANIAVLESMKVLLNLGDTNLLERRAVFNLKDLTIAYEV